MLEVGHGLNFGLDEFFLSLVHIIVHNLDGYLLPGLRRKA